MDTTAESITTNGILALSNALPCISNQMPVSEPEKQSPWKYQHPSHISDLTPTALSNLSTRPSSHIHNHTAKNIYPCVRSEPSLQRGF